jgi:hypothetical protein
MKKTRTFPIASRNSANMTQLEIVFVSGIRRQRILLHAHLMVIDHGDGFPTTMVEVVESQTKHVTAIVHSVQCHYGIGEVK